MTLGIYRPGEEPEPSLIDDLVQKYLATLYPGERTETQEHAITLTRVALDLFTKFANEELAARPVRAVRVGLDKRYVASRILLETNDGRLLRLTAPVDTTDQPKPA